MAQDNFPYEKITFILNVISFIGSIGFYYGVLKNIKTTSREKQQIAELEKQLEDLKKQLAQAQNRS